MKPKSVIAVAALLVAVAGSSTASETGLRNTLDGPLLRSAVSEASYVSAFLDHGERSREVAR